MTSFHQYAPFAEAAYSLWQAYAKEKNKSADKKDDGSLVTELDFAISNALSDWQQNFLPHFNSVTLDEELKPLPNLKDVQAAKNLLLHDPVDWTSNLARLGNRHTLANVCCLNQQNGVWAPVFAGTIVPAKQEVWWVDAGGVHAKKLGFKGWFNAPELNLDLPTPEQRQPDTLALDVAVKRRVTDQLEDNYRVIYGASIDSALTAITHPVYALLFEAKPWDMAFYPALSAQGFKPYTLSNGELITPFNPTNFWGKNTQTWCNAQQPVVFLTEAEKNPKAYINNLRQHLAA